eukprot:11731479-Ditylum_brightwellii.AAC.1
MGVDCSSIELLNWSDKVWHLWEHQQEIGWEHIFRGRFLTQWMELQHRHLHKKGLLNNKYTGHMWTINIITFLWDKFFVMWDYRNECLHKSESSYAKERQTALLTMHLKA